jgi:hypothetical protein
VRSNLTIISTSKHPPRSSARREPINKIKCFQPAYGIDENSPDNIRNSPR